MTNNPKETWSYATSDYWEVRSRFKTEAIEALEKLGVTVAGAEEKFGKFVNITHADGYHNTAIRQAIETIKNL